MTAGDVMDGSGSALNTTAASPIRITIPGLIVAWQRARRHRLADGRVISFTDPKVETYHGLVRTVAAQAMSGRPPITGAIEMTVIAVFPVPASWSAKKRAQALAGTIAKVSRPDIENLFKGAVDAMQSVVFNDDKQIVALHAQKLYGTVPCLDIELRSL
jgi:Holliday junction resolvase RusA-like endonuclease